MKDGADVNLDVDEDFPEHPKTLRLVAALGVDGAPWFLIRLWSWAKKYQPNGDLSAYSAREIEIAAGWAAGDGRFFAAAVAAGFIDLRCPACGDRVQIQDGIGACASCAACYPAATPMLVRCTIHNWMRRTGAAIRRVEDYKARDRNYKRNARRAQRSGAGQQSMVVSDGRPSDKRRNPRVPYRSDPYRTDPERGARAGAPPPPPGSAAPKGRKGLWPASYWFGQFAVGWEGAHRKDYHHGGEARARRRLAAVLGHMKVDQRLEAQGRAREMIAEFMADDGERVMRARHSFGFFVASFAQLCQPRGSAKPADRRAAATAAETATARAADTEAEALLRSVPATA